MTSSRRASTIGSPKADVTMRTRKETSRGPPRAYRALASEMEQTRTKTHELRGEDAVALASHADSVASGAAIGESSHCGEAGQTIGENTSRRSSSIVSSSRGVFENEDFALAEECELGTDEVLRKQCGHEAAEYSTGKRHRATTKRRNSENENSTCVDLGEDTWAWHLSDEEKSRSVQRVVTGPLELGEPTARRGP
mmetsp:Transcript_76311/g.247523  ORF Transcript_76311/g.247523 Transcript_76311/m.247523 type:complete len:196 (+) Transcript_76311:947-1534(+)